MAQVIEKVGPTSPKIEQLVPASAIVSTKVLEQLTQRFQKYKKDVNATLIALYKDTKKLLQNQELDPEQLSKVEETPMKREVKEESNSEAGHQKHTLLKKRRHTNDGDDEDFKPPAGAANIVSSEGEKKKRGRKPGQKNGSGKAAIACKNNANILVSMNAKRSSLNPEEQSEKEPAKEDTDRDEQKSGGKKRGRKPGTLNPSTYEKLKASGQEPPAKKKDRLKEMMDEVDGNDSDFMNQKKDQIKKKEAEEKAEIKKDRPAS